MTDRNNKKIHVFEVLIFWKQSVTVNLKKFFSHTIFKWYTSGKLCIVNSFISVKDLIRWKRDFEIFLIDHYDGDTGNKNTTGKY